MAIAWPVTAAAPTEASQATASATSSGATSRPCGLLRVSNAFASAAPRPVLDEMVSIARSSSGVSVNPGQTALTVIPAPASSRASARVRPTTACLAAQ